MQNDRLKKTRDDGTTEDVQVSGEDASVQPEEGNIPQPTKVSANLNISSAARTIKVGS